MIITLQTYDNSVGWQNAAEIDFVSPTHVRIEYEIDYATNHLGQKGSKALSVSLPVGLEIYEGDLHGFIMDLIPQGPQLRRIINHYGIKHENDIEGILTKAAISPPGNIRIAEPWKKLDSIRKKYSHVGFTELEIIDANENFVEYMIENGAPVGGTSGVAGGAPKYLLRVDQKGRYHADGMLPDEQTVDCILVKFPFTDSQNSLNIQKAEKGLYDVLKKLPIRTGKEIKIVDGVLFVSRFDRIFENGRLTKYLGLESLYSAHNINIHGATLYHEDNIALIINCTTDPKSEVIEYLKRDWLNSYFSNTDNHGRNFSLIKDGENIILSPVYDFTAMKFFKSEVISEQTVWKHNFSSMAERINYLEEKYKIDGNEVNKSFEELKCKLIETSTDLQKYGIPKEFIDRGASDRKASLDFLKN